MRQELEPGVVEWTFDTTYKRDAWLKQKHPKRVALASPGMYLTPTHRVDVSGTSVIERVIKYCDKCGEETPIVPQAVLMHYGHLDEPEPFVLCPVCMEEPPESVVKITDLDGVELYPNPQRAPSTELTPRHFMSHHELIHRGDVSVEDYVDQIITRHEKGISMEDYDYHPTAEDWA